jgi:hypothetical protein
MKDALDKSKKRFYLPTDNTFSSKAKIISISKRIDYSIDTFNEYKLHDILHIGHARIIAITESLEFITMRSRLDLIKWRATQSLSNEYLIMQILFTSQ